MCPYICAPTVERESLGVSEREGLRGSKLTRIVQKKFLYTMEWVRMTEIHQNVEHSLKYLLEHHVYVHVHKYKKQNVTKPRRML